jgi:hypothetical protein
MYDDYRFVTREELERLGMMHLVGTGLHSSTFQLNLSRF